MANCKRDLSNYVKRVEEVVSMCCKLECLWGEASIELAQKLQYLVFPNGIFWDKEIDNYRTNEANSVLGIISKISASYENKKEENSLKSSSLVNLCKSLTNSRTFIEDYLRIIDFLDYLNEEYPQLYKKIIQIETD